MSLPKLIHQIWLGDDMPEHVYNYIKSITAHADRNGWYHRVWNRLDLEGPGRSFRIDHKLGSWASITNMLRLQIMEKYGGIYLDADCEVIKPLDDLLVHNAFGARQDTDRICNAVFGAEPGHPWIRWQLQNASRYASADAAWGVYLMSEAPREGVTVLPTEYFYPFLWDAKPQDRKPHPNTYVVHHWLKSWG